MVDVSKELLAKFKDFRDKKGGEINIADIDTIILEFASVVEKHVTENDRHIYEEIRGIGDKIQETKQGISENLPEGIVNEASMELDAVVKSTEDATNKILDSVEKIQKTVGESSDSELSGKITQDISDIFEACNFQDLTGQRIKKVTSALTYIEKAVGGLIGSFSGDAPSLKSNDKRKDAGLMNGPQTGSDAPSQDDVDKLFDSV